MQFALNLYVCIRLITAWPKFPFSIVSLHEKMHRWWRQRVLGVIASQFGVWPSFSPIWVPQTVTGNMCKWNSFEFSLLQYFLYINWNKKWREIYSDYSRMWMNACMQDNEKTRGLYCFYCMLCLLYNCNAGDNYFLSSALATVWPKLPTHKNPHAPPLTHIRPSCDDIKMSKRDNYIR